MFRTTDCSQRRILLIFAVCFLTLLCATHTDAQVLGDPVDVGQDFMKMENVYFVGSGVKSFDPATGSGTLQWDRYLRNTTLSFNKIDVSLRPWEGNGVSRLGIRSRSCSSLFDHFRLSANNTFANVDAIGTTG